MFKNNSQSGGALAVAPVKSSYAKTPKIGSAKDWKQLPLPTDCVRLWSQCCCLSGTLSQTMHVSANRAREARAGQVRLRCGPDTAQLWLQRGHTPMTDKDIWWNTCSFGTAQAALTCQSPSNLFDHVSVFFWMCGCSHKSTFQKHDRTISFLQHNISAVFEWHT